MRKSFCALLALILLVSVCLARVTSAAPTRQEVIGTWLGFTDSANDFYRVILTDRGGFVGHSFARGRAELYRIESWELGPKSRLTIRTSPISTNAYHIEMEGLVTASRMQFTVSGSRKEGWRQEVPLYREEFLADQISALRRSMEGLH